MGPAQKNRNANEIRPGHRSSQLRKLSRRGVCLRQTQSVMLGVMRHDAEEPDNALEVVCAPGRGAYKKSHYSKFSSTSCYANA
jgi:hypothetical protein